MFGGSGYPAGKGGVNALTLAAAADLKSSGVRVNAVLPGARSRLSTGDDYVRHIEGLHERGILDDGCATPPSIRRRRVCRAAVCLPRRPDVQRHHRADLQCRGWLHRPVRPAQPSFIAYRDHNDSDPYSLDELAALLG